MTTEVDYYELLEVERTADADLRANDAAGLRLELRTKLAPIDEIRSDQRGKQRNDKSDCQSEQRRLHGLSPQALSDARRSTSQRTAEADDCCRASDHGARSERPPDMVPTKRAPKQSQI